MDLNAYIRDVAESGARRAAARQRHAEASAYIDDEVGPAFEAIRDALAEAGVACSLEVGTREARLLLGDGQSVRLTLHTAADRCDTWFESSAFPSFVSSRPWSRRWRAGEPHHWPSRRVTAALAHWFGTLPHPPLPAQGPEADPPSATPA